MYQKSVGSIHEQRKENENEPRGCFQSFPPPIKHTMTEGRERKGGGKKRREGREGTQGIEPAKASAEEILFKRKLGVKEETHK